MAPDGGAGAATASATGQRLLTGWGAATRSRATVVRPRSAAEAVAALRAAAERGALPRRLGRSYGDAAQNAGGRVLDMTALDAIGEVDGRRRLLTAQAGVSLDRLMRVLLPRGLFLPVTPGTRQVTLGGAVACDIHGKNHHVDRGFGAHVARLSLATPDGTVRDVGPGDDAFAVTVGGMGLTGAILDVTVRLLPVQTSHMVVETERAGDLDDLMARLTAGDERHRYSVAWIDGTATGRRLGRGVITRGDHARMDDLPVRLRRRATAFAPATRLAVPRCIPGGVLSRSTVGAFNEFWYRRAPRARHGEVQPLSAFFHPLDGVRDWNRLYGPRGLLQYQLVVPFARPDVLRTALERLAAMRAPSFLGVLKRLGPGDGLLSFPMPGWTLALDVPAARDRLDAVLDGLDEVVAEAGGRVYLAKDARLRPDLLGAMYPALERWREIRRGLDPGGRLRSDLDRRLALTG